MAIGFMLLLFVAAALGSRESLLFDVVIFCWYVKVR